MKKILLISLLTIMCLTLVGCGSGSKNANSTLVKFLDAYKNKDAKSVCETYLPQMFDMNFEDMAECTKMVKEDFYDEFDYEIGSSEEMTGDQYDENKRTLVEYYDLSEEKIESIVSYHVKVSFIYDGTKTNDEVELPLLKYDGKWYVLFG